ncbi:hypothetical protein EZV62_020011 [Acer yangbiense]|uniref:Sieve element occlusion N-terminal domain-containing protein n=1 Tax=Acer yangbiense TaxID=1000413 RepID=A0A5C7HDR0_9ROSI|nr:hypothetical protein EZV62_020011 [Acer yangbiense]
MATTKQTPANLIANPTTGNLQAPLMGNPTPANPQPLMGNPTPASAALQHMLTNPAQPAARQQFLSNQAQAAAAAPTMQQQMLTTPAQAAASEAMHQIYGNQTPVNLQHTPGTVQQPLLTGGQHAPTDHLQQQFGSHQIPAHAQPHMVINRNRQQPQLGLMQTPTNVAHQPQHTTAVQKQIVPTVNDMQPQQMLATNQALHNPMMRSDRLMFSSSDDTVMSKQIQATHVPDGREIDVKPLLFIVEDIFKRAVPSVLAISGLDGQASTEAIEESTYQSNFMGMLEAMAYVIDRISCEISCKCSGGGDAHATTIAILNMLTSYSWDAKLAIALSAFAVNYGEFWLVAQSYTTNQLSKAVAILKQLPEILENSSMLKPQFDAIKNLIKAMVDISKCIGEFRELPTHYISSDVEALTTARSHVPVAVYWTIRSILACSSQITGLTLLGREHMVSTTEAWELSSLAHKLSNMHTHLKTQLAICYKLIEEKKHIEGYQNLRHLFDMAHIDNMKILRALIYQKDDLLPLVDGATKNRVNIEVLRRKNVLLLISDLDISQEEIVILEQIYSEARQHTRHDSLYEVVWLPILDPTIPWTETKQERFEDLKSTMPWYTVHHPSLIDRAVIKFTKEVWNFQKKPILVVLDPHGRVVCPNALHMMWIWGSLAFPFTTAKEEALWREETWRLELLVDGIDPVVMNWMNEGRYICLYGGEDMDWIRKFTTTANAVAQAAGISLGMVYVGKSNPKERVRRNNATITEENLSHCWQDLTSIWYFWVRIASMWHSKNQLGKTVENDHVMNEIMTMLSFDGSEGGWAVLARGNSELVRAKGGLFLTCLQDYEKHWREPARQKGVIPALQDHLNQLHTPHHCNRFVLPGTAGSIPENVVCSECGKSMQRYIMYQCCDE